MILLFLAQLLMREPAPTKGATYRDIVKWLRQEKVDLSPWWIDENMPELMEHVPELHYFPLQHLNRKIMMFSMNGAAYGVFLLDAESLLINPIVFESMANITNPRVFSFEKRDYFSLHWSRPAGTGIQNAYTKVWYMSDQGMVPFWSGHDQVLFRLNEEDLLYYEITHFVESQPGRLSAVAELSRPLGAFYKGNFERWCRLKQKRDLDDFSPNHADHLPLETFMAWWCTLDVEPDVAIPTNIRELLAGASCATVDDAEKQP